jgi:thioesterase domain-containing protein/acyl carrier protein
LRAFLKQKLPDYMLPAEFVSLEALPRTPNGKLDRRALAVHAPAQPLPGQTAAPPRDPVELYLVQVWEELLSVRPIGVADNFFDLGGHSLLAVRLMARIEQVFGRNLPVATLFQAPTIEHLAQRLRQVPAPATRTPLVGIQTGGSRPPFFCVHPVSGSVLGYVELARRMGPDQPFYGLQAAGLDDDRAPATQIEVMAADYIAAVRGVQPSGPYLLGGWSIGGVIAFEMARQLRQQGHEVALLALLDSFAPLAGRQDSLVDLDDATLLAGFIKDLSAPAGAPLSVSVEALRRLGPDDQVDDVLAQARQGRLIPPEIGSPQIRQRLRVMRANAQAAARYVPQAAPGHAVLFRAAERASTQPLDPTLGWEALIAGTLELRSVPGDHYTMFAAPHVQTLAEQLKACFDAALACRKPG